MEFINYTHDGKAVIQPAALLLSKLEQEEVLELHTLDNAIVLLKSEMTPLEKSETMCALMRMVNALSADLMCGFDVDEDSEKDEDCDDSIPIPAEVLDAAGIWGESLRDDCAKNVIDRYGFKRVGWVLSNTIQRKDYDGRFSSSNKAWAKQTFIPSDDHNLDFVVESHPAVLDGFVNEFRNMQAELQMFDQTHCDSMTGQELEGKVLVMSPYTLKESYWAPENQLWLATGGFGCRPTAAGRAVYATCLSDGEQVRWNREDFIGILREEHLPDWAKEKLMQLQQETPDETPDMTTQSM